MENKNFTEKDLEMAERIGKIEQGIFSLNQKIDTWINKKDEDTSTIWQKIEKHSDKLENHSGMFRWLIGMGIGLQIAWGAFIALFKH